METVTLKIKGMTCALCSIKIEKNLLNIEGISDISVNFATEKAKVSYDPLDINLEEIRKTIEKLGFTVNDKEYDNENSDDIEIKKLKYSLIISTILSLPMLVMTIICTADVCCAFLDPNSNSAFSEFISSLRFKLSFMQNWKLQLLLTIPVQFIIGFRFYKGAYYAIKSKSLNMDVLVVIGTTTTFLYSLYISLKGYTEYSDRKTCYDCSSIIITLVLLGRYLEALAKSRTTGAIKELIQLQPKTASVIIDGEENQISIKEVKVGDILIVRPGEQIAVDGILTSGYSSVDESILTGESIPVDKVEGNTVIGGSLNKFGTFRYEATKVGDETFLSNIIKLVEEAQGSKAPIQKLADKISGVFIPFILLVSIGTFLIWYFIILNQSLYMIEKAILIAVSVLVISCPCALGLATPAAITVGIGRGAKDGILIKSGEELENACKIDTVILDKTGTITKGKPEVSDVIVINKNSLYSSESLSKIASLAEKYSEHPLGKAIYQNGQHLLKDEELEPEKFEIVPGKGVKVSIDNKKVFIGTEKFLNENNIKTFSSQNKISEIRSKGKVVTLIAIDGILEGIISLEDKIKETSIVAIDELKRMGIEIYMLTGDSKRTAIAIGNKVGIQNIIAEVLPDEKANIVKNLKNKGHKVAMVGDGINDAPAIASSDVGFAIGSGTDVAIETGGIVILKNDLLAVPKAINLSKKTMTKIKQNLFWAFIYNIIGIPIAAFGLLRPEVAAATMALSSVSVILNSLSLKKYRFNVGKEHIGA